MQRLKWPVVNHIVTSGYGWRPDPFGSGRWDYHGGLDLASKDGPGDVAAAEAGTVIVDVDIYDEANRWTNATAGAGKFVILRHEIDQQIFYTRYLHLAENIVRPGQIVKRGEKIGTMGSTGASTGPHLHFDLYQGSQNPGDWRLADPSPFLMEA